MTNEPVAMRGMSLARVDTSRDSRRLRLPDLGSRGEGWVMLQLGVFAVVIAAGFVGPSWDGPIRAVLAGVGLVLVAAGAALCVRGIADIRAHITPFPRPGDRAELMQGGAFGIVRHPIYGGLLLGSVGLSLLAASPASLVATAATALVLVLKSLREEAWLVRRYPGVKMVPHITSPWVTAPHCVASQSEELCPLLEFDYEGGRKSLEDRMTRGPDGSMVMALPSAPGLS